MCGHVFAIPNATIFHRREKVSFVVTFVTAFSRNCINLFISSVMFVVRYNLSDK